MQSMTTSESEYEYEYDETETETFYVNIDLTSHNGLIHKPRHDGQALEQEGDEDQDASLRVDERGTEGGGVDDSTMNIEETGQNEGIAENDDYIQIMELHSKNPVVSYRNHIFSCEWADMIGTDMHFVSQKDSESDDPTYLKNADDYSLIAANPIKIIGRRAEFGGPIRIPTNGKNAGKPGAQTEAGVSSSSAETGLFLSQQQENKSIQVRFLQELMDIKREKGETDMMQMVYGTKRGRSFGERIREWARTEERKELVHKLNRAALAGDQDAVFKLEVLYNQIEMELGAASVETAPTG